MKKEGIRWEGDKVGKFGNDWGMLMDDERIMVRRRGDVG